MEKEIIQTTQAPKAIGPYVQATKIAGFLFTSGQIALNPETNTVVEGDVTVQAHQVFKNLLAILKEANMEISDVVKTTCFLKNIEDFAAFNEVYASYFDMPAPSRSCVEVSRLPKDVLCEVEIVAYKK